MEREGSSPNPCTVTVRRNPHRKARPTPSSTAPASLLRSSSSLPQNISSFPIEDILSIEVPEKILTEASSENLKVFIRIRTLISQRETLKKEKTVAEMKKTKIAWPKNPKSTNALTKKLKKSNEVCVKVNDAHSVTVSPPQSLQDGKRIKSEVYQGFSQVFSSEASQREVYEKVVNPLVEDFLKGRSGMLAALGPSGSGKTHTIFGCARDPGMVPLALRQILSQERMKMQSQRMFYLSMFEICSEKGKSEKIFDLIQDGADFFVQQISIKGMREVVIYDPQQAESVIACGLLKRATAMTNSNSQSSRSQCIINICCEYKKVDGKAGDNSNSAVLTIVDLAGAEREKKTGNQGIRLLESNFINNTSMVFGLCLRSLLEHQKNPRKPMQKHFQNSLLTRYLRDYLEGKKRMALLLTVRPGEEDYLDTSFLLRQASPYTKIKFDIIEEHGILNHNKRLVQIPPSLVQLKRMKLSRIEDCEINQGSDECPELLNKEAAAKGMKDVGLTDVRVQSEEIIITEANVRNILRVDHVELERKERKHQILQNFGKALWKVLKEYKKKLEVAENEICTLRNCLTSEKTRSAELENQQRDWQSHCCCMEGISSEMSSREMVSREEHQSTGCNEIAQKLKSYVKDATDVEDLKNTNEMKAESTHWNGKATAVLSGSGSCTDQDCERGEENSDFVVSISNVTFMNRDENDLVQEEHTLFDAVLPEHIVSFSGSSLFVENNSSFPMGEAQARNKEDKVKLEVYSTHLEGSLHKRKEELLDSILESSIGGATGAEDLKNTNEMKAESTHWNGKATTALSGSCSFTDQEYRRKEEIIDSIVSTSQVTSIERDENDLLEEDHLLFDSVLPECCTVSTSKSSLCENNSSFPVGEDQTQNKEDRVKSEVYSRHLEGSAHTRNEKWLDSTTAQQLEGSTRDATGVEDLKNTNGIKAESIDWKGKATAVLSGSCSCIDYEYEQEKGNSDSVDSTSQATFINRDENCLLEDDHMLSDSVCPECTSSSKSSLSIENKSCFPERENQTQNGEDKRLLCPSTTLMPGAVVGHVVETVTKQASGTKFQNADKPKRRLLPASAILFKDIGSINFKDVNEKPKGVKAEKKGVSGENRTQGSISLLRLLKDNLAS